MVGKTKQLEAREPNVRKTGQIKLPSQTESIVRVPVTPSLYRLHILNQLILKQKLGCCLSGKM
jgi:hypothetical protein